MKDGPTYTLDRTFDAPRELVWRGWTEPELLARWYGPNVKTIIHELDVRPGGLWLNEMQWGGKSNYQKTEYLEVVAPERLVCVMSSTDEAWNIKPNPMMADWPRSLLTTVTFVQAGDQTKLRLTWVPHEATEAEIASFAASLAGAEQGWASGMDELAELLAELQRRG